MKLQPIETAHAYMDLVSRYSWLVDSELKKAESAINESPEHGPESIINSIPKLISLVNVVGYLRGQDYAFIDVRPHEVINQQSELCKNEDEFEARLIKIVQAAYDNPKNREKYEWRIRNYFLKARLLNYFESSSKEKIIN